MAVKDLTPSTNFQVHYEDSIPNAQARAQAIANACEYEFTITSGWFGISGAFGPSDRIHVYVDRADSSGANNFGYQSGGKTNIHVDAQSGNASAANASEIVKMLFMAELVEVFMSYNNQHGANSWNAADSAGEALSQLCNIERFPTGHYLYYGSWVDSWLQSPARADWISTSEATDGNPVSFGCGLLFLYYLKSQRGFSIEQIIKKGGPNLEALYFNLTGASGAFNAFNTLVSQYFPSGQTPAFSSYDNPFPLYASTGRSVSLSTIAVPDGADAYVTSGVAHVKPFVMCPGGDYSFTIESTPQVVITSTTTRGFGQPVFAWRVNGVNVAGVGGFVTVQATVKVDDFADPQQHTTSLQNVTVNCAIATSARQSTIAVHVPSAVIGHIDLQIEALVSEKFVSPATQTSGSDWIAADTERVQWEERYYQDRDACRKAWNNLIHRYEVFNDIPIVFTLPDPPPEYERALRYLVSIEHALTAAREKAPAAAEAIERAIVMTLNLTPELLRDFAARASSRTAAVARGRAAHEGGAEL